VIGIDQNGTSVQKKSSDFDKCGGITKSNERH